MFHCLPLSLVTTLFKAVPVQVNLLPLKPVWDEPGIITYKGALTVLPKHSKPFKIKRKMNFACFSAKPQSKHCDMATV